MVFQAPTPQPQGTRVFGHVFGHMLELTSETIEKGVS